ncbi:MAG TPA: cyclic nucleotide-binding domain-containing protein [Actinomycetota bacterium]|jgi:cAMP-dependent protein kinase regulator
MATNKQLLAALAAVPLFEGLSKRQLKQIADLAEIAQYMAGATLVKEGELGESFFVILSGEAKVKVRGRTVNRAIPGDHFGEISLLDGGMRTASVVSETPLTVLMISRPAFQKLLRKDPSLSMQLLKSMARLVRRVDRSLAG